MQRPHLETDITRCMHTNDGGSPRLSGPSFPFFPPRLCLSVPLLHHLLPYLYSFYLCPCTEARAHTETHTHARAHTQTSVSSISFLSLLPSPSDNLKGRQLLHTTYKMFMTAAGVEGKISFPSRRTHTRTQGDSSFGCFHYVFFVFFA